MGKGRNPLVKKYAVSMVVVTEDDVAIRIIETSWKNVYSVIYEDAYQSGDCGHKFMTDKEIEKKYQLIIERFLP